MHTGTILRWVTNVQNTSAILAATFLTVHLAAPLTALVGGEHAATQTMVGAAVSRYRITLKLLRHWPDGRPSPLPR